MTSAVSSSTALDLLRQHSEHLHEYFKTIHSRYDSAPEKLMESVQYSILAGGKRLRPTLVLECCQACSGNKTKSSAKTNALAAAAAMEFIHTFSLVHDDLPAMDDDDLRRGRPTNHKVFGEAIAILAGDAMTTMAFEIIAVDAEPTIVPRLIKELAHASGPLGMIGGQVLDINGEEKSLSLPELQKIHRMKTGALLTASCRMGAIAAGASESMLSNVTDYGRHLGLAFQIIDDVLDVTSTPEQMGKATNKDAAAGKNTYPVLMGLEKSQQEAKHQLQLALDAVKDFGESGEGLRALAKFVVEREA